MRYYYPTTANRAYLDNERDKYFSDDAWLKRMKSGLGEGVSNYTLLHYSAEVDGGIGHPYFFAGKKVDELEPACLGIKQGTFEQLVRCGVR